MQLLLSSHKISATFLHEHWYNYSRNISSHFFRLLVKSFTVLRSKEEAAEVQNNTLQSTHGVTQGYIYTYMCSE